MAQKGLITRAGKGLLDVLMLLLRGVGALVSAFASFVLLAWANEDRSTDSDSHRSPEIDDDTAKSYGWKSW